MTAYSHGCAHGAPIGSPACVALPNGPRIPTRDDAFAAGARHAIAWGSPVADRLSCVHPAPEKPASVPGWSERTGC